MIPKFGEKCKPLGESQGGGSGVGGKIETGGGGVEFGRGKKRAEILFDSAFADEELKIIVSDYRSRLNDSNHLTLKSVLEASANTNKQVQEGKALLVIT